MKRFLVFCLLFFAVLTIYSAPHKIEVKPKFYASTMFNFLWNKDDGIGFNLLGFDCALLKYRAFYFLDFGTGIVLLREPESGWIDVYAGSVYLDTVYMTWKDWRLTYYFKFVPVKLPVNLSQDPKDRNKLFLDLGIAYTAKNHWAIVFGLSIKFF